MLERRKKFGQIAAHLGYASKEDVEKALKRQKTVSSFRPIGEILINEGKLTHEQVAIILGAQFDLYVFDEEDFRVSPELLDGNIAILYRVIPLKQEASVLFLAISYEQVLNSKDVMANLERLLDTNISLVLATADWIKDSLDRYYTVEAEHQRERSKEMNADLKAIRDHAKKITDPENFQPTGRSQRELSRRVAELEKQVAGMEAMRLTVEKLEKQMQGYEKRLPFKTIGSHEV